MLTDAYITVAEAMLHPKKGGDVLTIAFRIPHPISFPYSSKIEERGHTRYGALITKAAALTRRAKPKEEGDSWVQEMARREDPDRSWVRAFSGARLLEERILAYLSDGKRPLLCEANEIKTTDTALQYRVTLRIAEDPRRFINLANALANERLLDQRELSLHEAAGNAGVAVSIDAPTYGSFLVGLNSAAHNPPAPGRVA